MTNSLCEVIISEYNYDKIKVELDRLNIPINIHSHNFGSDQSIIVYDGYDFYFENFERHFRRKSDLDITIVKRGDKKAPGLFKSGSLDDKKYKHIRF